MKQTGDTIYMYIHDPYRPVSVNSNIKTIQFDKNIPDMWMINNKSLISGDYLSTSTI